MRRGNGASLPASPVQVETAAEIGQWRFARVIDKRLPMIFASNFHEPPVWVRDHVLRVAIAACAAPVRSSKGWWRRWADLHHEVRAERVHEGSVPELLPRVSEIEKVEVDQVGVVATGACCQVLLDSPIHKPPDATGGRFVDGSEVPESGDDGTARDSEEALPPSEHRRERRRASED